MATVINGSDASDADDSDTPCCFICLGGTEESGEPLTRECSCRGTMGYVHRSCLVKFMGEKKNQCVICKQPYKNTNELASIVGEVTIHSILLVVLKLSLLCLIGYSMALQSVQIWKECLRHGKEMSHLLSELRLLNDKFLSELFLSFFKLFYQCAVICALLGGDLEHITNLVLGCVIVISTLHFMSWVGFTC